MRGAYAILWHGSVSGGMEASDQRYVSSVCITYICTPTVQFMLQSQKEDVSSRNSTTPVHRLFLVLLHSSIKENGAGPQYHTQPTDRCGAFFKYNFGKGPEKGGTLVHLAWSR